MVAAAGLGHHYREMTLANPLFGMHPDRLLPADADRRAVARRLYQQVAALPLVCPHGHVDPRLLVDNRPFSDPASLFVTPDHYVTRLLHADGVALEDLGVGQGPLPEAAARGVWRRLCERWAIFAGTPVRWWLEAELAGIFGVTSRPSAETADAIFDQVAERLAADAFRPRALYERFNISVLATTADPCDDLSARAALDGDPSWSGRVVPAFRPDRYLQPGRPNWSESVRRLGEAAEVDTGDYPGYLEALETRRRYSWPTERRRPTTATPTRGPTRSATRRRLGSTAPRSPVRRPEPRPPRSAGTCCLRWPACPVTTGWSCRCIAGCAATTTPRPRPVSGPTSARTSRSRSSSPTPCARCWSASAPTRASTWSSSRSTRRSGRASWLPWLAPLAGFYPSVYVGVPWWFLDAPDAIGRFRAAVTETAGFTRTSGFVDDTRAFCSIPARHDMARRLDASFLARLVTEHRLDETEAAAIAADLVVRQPTRVFKL